MAAVDFDRSPEAGRAVELDALRILLYLNLEDPPTLRSWLYNSPIVSSHSVGLSYICIYIYMYIYINVIYVII